MSLRDIVSSPLLYILLAGLVFVIFVVAARFVAQQVAEALRRRGLRENVVVVGSRVITVALIVVGALFAFGIAVRSDNVTILGIVAAVVITSFGAQDLLKDYVSGYYILLERNIKLFHSSQRFAQFAPQLGRRLAERVQHLLLGRSRDLLLSQRVSALAIHHLQFEHILAAQTAN